MKYDKTLFTITANDGSCLADETAMQTARDLVAALAGEAGYESFEETPDGIVGYVQTTLAVPEVLETVMKDFPMEGVRVDCQTTPAEDRNWNEDWENAGFDPIVVGGKCVVHDLIRPYDGPPMPVDVVIEARQAFGTANHETTRLMIEQLLGVDLNGLRVLDCGCGTGILSIVAAKCGARQVVGYDIDEWSVKNSQHNAQLNHVEEQMTVLLGDANVLSHINGLFDVVMANINRNILLADMKSFADVMGHGARLLLSGFYVEDGIVIAEHAGQLGLTLQKTMSENDWCCMTFEK